MRDRYDAKDRFCSAIDRRLRDGDGVVERLLSTSMEPWWPFPDSLHNSSLEVHIYRLALNQALEEEANGSGSQTEGPLEGQPKQKSRWKPKPKSVSYLQRPNPLPRRLSAQELCREPNRDYCWDEDVGCATPSWSTSICVVEPAEQDLLFKKGNPPLWKQKSRSAMKTPTFQNTGYGRFDEDVFGRKESVPNERTKSMLSMELKLEDEIKDVEEGMARWRWQQEANPGQARERSVT